MHINIRSKGLDVTASLQKFIEEKFGGLSKFLKNFEAQGVAELNMTVARTSPHHQKGEVFRVSADLKLPKKILRASEDNEDVRVAIDLVKRKLHLEIEKYKTLYSETKKGGRR